jgi:hypothetical protein
MKNRTDRKNLPLKIGISYLLFIIFALALAFRIAGVQGIISHASKSKPYSVIFQQERLGGFFSRRGTEHRQGQTNILLFGDSNMFHPASAEDNHLASIIERSLRSGEDLSDVRVLNWDYTGASMFCYYCMFWWATDYSPDLIIIPINWRSFGKEWDEVVTHEYFHPELSGLVPFSERFSSLDFNPVKANGISLIKQLEYRVSLYSVYFVGMRGWARSNLIEQLGFLAGGDDSAPMPQIEAVQNDEATAESSVRSTAVSPADDRNVPPEIPDIIPRLEKAGSLEDFFPMRFEESNTTLLTIEALADAAARSDTKILFFVWPLDHELLASKNALDKESLSLSIQMLREATDSNNVYFKDLSELLRHRDFFDFWGHCKVEGRQKIGASLASAVRDVLKEKTVAGADGSR